MMKAKVEMRRVSLIARVRKVKSKRSLLRIVREQFQK